MGGQPQGYTIPLLSLYHARHQPLEIVRLQAARQHPLAAALSRSSPIARGTSCPGHVLVPWAHSPIWSRQDPIFVSLTQIASYKR